MKKILLLAAVAAIALVSCKPTERNYREAYDVAVGKREKVSESLAADGLISEDAPRGKVVDGDTLYFVNEILRVDDGVSPLKQLNVAVAVFKMNTNARAGASMLSEKGYDARAARALEDKWYIIAGSFDSMDDTRAFIARFRKENPSYPYIGLGGNPVIIRR
ncbi:hypothetical protein [Sangeribacter muris]|uniref:hypothetical protein n=1 Tax=Sangeribacter muris TaxID=2880703 RepID=UPI000FFF5B04|nr:hypothetical protein [Sangeribacter muris]RXE68476.1 hypothetical protein ED328_06675 [Muribaculaceae bacterium Isolate-001 (NCI)]